MRPLYGLIIRARTLTFNSQKEVFGDEPSYQNKGSMAAMFNASQTLIPSVPYMLTTGVQAPMVLVMSIWDDHSANMLWLDSEAYPVDADPAQPGIARGTCPTSSGVPSEVEAQYPNSSVTFSAIKFGPINSTYTGS